MLENCSKQSIVRQFLSNCDVKEGIAFCRGLYYQIFDALECVIKQGDEGSAYYIILQGECTVFVNKLLLDGEVANPVYICGRGGIGKRVNVIRCGEDFGDEALLRNEKRNASIVASDDIVECLVCDQLHFKKSIQRHRDMEIEQMIGSARKSFLFAGSDRSYLQMLFKQFKKITLAKHTLLQTQSRTVRQIFLLLNGRCKEFVQIKDANGRSRKEFICEFGGDDSAICVGGYYVNKLPLSSIICETECEALTIGRDEFEKYLREETRTKINNVGKKKHHFIQKQIEKFQFVIADIAKRFDMETNVKEDDTQTIGHFEYGRHGKWGRKEQICIDKLIKNNGLKETVSKQPKLFDIDLSENEQSDDSTHHLNVNRVDMTEGIVDNPVTNEQFPPIIPQINIKRRNAKANGANVNRRPITAPNICLQHSFRKHKDMHNALINVPSMERISMQIQTSTSPKKSQRYSANSAVIGGLFDYTQTHKQFATNTKRPQTVQNASFHQRREGEQKLDNQYANDMMVRNFDTHCFDDEATQNQAIYESMRHSLQSKNEKQRSSEQRWTRTASSTKYFAPKRIQRRRRRVVNNSKSMKRTQGECNGMLKGFPVLKIKTLRKKECEKAFGRSKLTKSKKTKKKKRVRKRYSDRTRIDMSEYETMEWIDYGNVLNEIKSLRHRFDEHVIGEAESMRHSLMRSGTCPDLLIKYKSMDHSNVMEQYVKHFKLPIPQITS